VKIKHEAGNTEAWVCICGNRPDLEGFYPCDALGNEVDPSDQWDGVSYSCDRCKIIIDQDTLRIIEGALGASGSSVNLGSI